MATSEKLIIIANNTEKVFNAGYNKALKENPPGASEEELQQKYNEGYDNGYAIGWVNGYDEGSENTKELWYNNGIIDGKKAEYDAFWDAYQENGNRKNYRYTFAGNGWAGIDLAKEMKYDIKIVDTSTTTRYAIGMFYNFNIGGGNNIYDMTELCKRLDFSDCWNAANIFGNSKVDNITVDFSNVIDMSNAFGGGDGGASFRTITLKVSEKCASYDKSFHYAQNLENLTFIEGSVIAANIQFKQSKLLSKASIESIINALSTTTSGLTITLSQTAVNNAFTSEEWEALEATKTNWNISLV